MPQRKLQIFVSSTYVDMQPERQAAVEAILQAGHIPAGMELFTSGDESQLETILRWIDESDVLLLLLGERYGSIEPKSGKAYVQLEYEHALHLGKRVFALVLSDKWIQEKYQVLGKNATDVHRTQHSTFKSLVLSKICRMVDDEKDIRIEISRSLANYASDETLSGWVRATEYSTMSRLVSELQNTISDLRAQPQSSAPSLAELHTEFEVRLQELRSIPLDLEFKYKFSGEADESTRQLVGNALGQLWYEHQTWLTYGLHSRQFPPTRYFISKIVPLLEVWGFVDRQRGEHLLTAKGRVFLHYLSQRGVDESDYVRFVSPEL